MMMMKVEKDLLHLHLRLIHLGHSVYHRDDRRTISDALTRPDGKGAMAAMGRLSATTLYIFGLLIGLPRQP